MRQIHNRILYTFLAFLIIGIASTESISSVLLNDSAKIIVRKTTDFKVTGDGNSINWNNADWLTITKQESSSSKSVLTQVKLLYSSQGIYFLFRCDDQKITATLQEDFAPLFKEDVVEVYLWPDQSVPIYFEYELSPLNFELPILIPNIKGRVQGWAPWRYEGKRRTQHATSVQGGEKKSHAAISNWSAEFFIPFSLLGSLIDGPPSSGARWRANFYRIDYDEGYNTWSWQKTTLAKAGNFHEYQKFGTIVFE
jgi:hypothetical protein